VCFFVQVKSDRAYSYQILEPQSSSAYRHSFLSVVRSAVCCALALASTGVAADWQSTLTKDPGTFPPLRPLHATYAFGWSGFSAATGEVHFTKPSEDHFQLDGTGRTTGLARALWKLDATHYALADAETLRPIETKQTETYRWKNLITHLTFKNNGVKSERTEGATTKSRDFDFPGLLDLHSAMLFLRSQPLKERGVYRIVVYPATSAYLATITVIGREKASIRAGTYKAIKLDLKLNKIGKNLELEPHRKFRRGTIWVSDDADRMLLRIEAQIFVGTVFAELQSVHYENPKS
jgi:hypothetical protein